MGLKFGGCAGSASSRIHRELPACTTLSLCMAIALSIPVTLIPTPASADQASDMQAMFLKAFGSKKKATPSQFTVDLKIDGETHQSVMVFNNKQQVVSRVKTVDLIPQLKSILKEDVFLELEKAIGDTKEVSFEWLAKHDIKAAYDTAALSLNLALDPEQREPLVLSLLQELSSTIRKDNKVEASQVSGYLNLYTNTELSYQEDEHSTDFQLQLDGSLTIDKATLQSQLTRNTDDWSLDKTYITYDEPENLRRYRAGEVSAITRNFQDSFSLIGLSVSKDFTLDKTQETQPKASERLILTTRSDVIILLNNFQIERYTLAPGTYLLEDIGLSNGQNDLTLKIIDSFGKETIKQSSQLFDTRLLKPELSKYAFAVGALSNSDTDEFAVNGIYQYGVSDTLTAGADAQVIGKQFLLGAEALKVVNAGVFDTGIAINGDASGVSGAAASVKFKPSFSREKGSVHWDVGGEVRSEQFTTTLFTTTLSDTDSDTEVTDDRSLETTLYLNTSKLLFDKWNTSLGVNYSRFYGADDALSLDLSTSRRFAKGISFSAGLNYQEDSDWSVKAQLSVPLGGKQSRRKRLGLLANGKDDSFEARYEIKARNSIGRDSLSGNLIHRQKGSSSEDRAEGAVRFPQFESHFSASHLSSDSLNQQRLQVGVNTSLACAGEDCAITYPIEDSFALVGGPKNQKQAIALNTGNRRFVYSEDEDSMLPISYAALIPTRDSKAVIHLDDYQTQRITVDEVSLPFGYNPEKTEFEASPGYHHGFSFDVGGEPGTVVDGVLVDKDGKPLAYKGGQWISTKNKDKAIAFFSNKAGRFRVPSMVSGSYRLELHDYPNMAPVEVDISMQDNGVQDLGNVAILL
ncbi:fimbria/pilus outer membrane usher protein [Leucothrix mucor]|uniref:fimbria/pilus outer membrane usher protein n=1 Tax=Leucothrix mucor TaxID=45248 RepID=UPI0003B484C5|nr:fimbria/pilus outer membrane usher protein [Leucothrix mucor]